MGKGDRKTRRGKIYAGSFGKTRPKEAEIKRRIDDVDSGRVKTVPADEVFARIEQRFRGK